MPDRPTTLTAAITAKLREMEQPVTPDLGGATDAALSAFLHVELFGWVQFPYSTLEQFLGNELPPLCPPGRVHAMTVGTNVDLCTPSGALRVIEAKPMGEWAWKFWQNDDASWTAEVRDGYATSYDHAVLAWKRPSFPRAVCEAAVLALLPAASEEGRRILNTP